ncbi:dCTP pyrophosphatase 1-like [Iris pallida]|uniref:dCTP pyrophosphatase 1-like n=1 Tax=Iris pallida TaxID=29817 RepID=A0AAX6HMN6_IRIPA|nr:dCTP pyrophosphatase 1-like [Iris pallida]
MADFAKERDWDQFHSPRNLLLALVGEVGELSEIFQWKGEVPKGLPDWKEEEKEHLGEELSDVLLYLVRLSDICGVDLGRAALRKVELNAKKYPISHCKGSSMKHAHSPTVPPPPMDLLLPTVVTKVVLHLCDVCLRFKNSVSVSVSVSEPSYVYYFPAIIKTSLFFFLTSSFLGVKL